MPGFSGQWTWSHFKQASDKVVAVMLIKPGHSIAITFPRPEEWIGEGKPDEDHIRTILLSAIQERWCAAPPAA